MKTRLEPPSTFGVRVTLLPELNNVCIRVFLTHEIYIPAQNRQRIGVDGQIRIASQIMRDKRNDIKWQNVCHWFPNN